MNKQKQPLKVFCKNTEAETPRNFARKCDRKIVPRKIASNKFPPGLGLGFRCMVRVMVRAQSSGGNFPGGQFSVYRKKDFLKPFTIFTGNHLCQGLFFKVFSCKFFEVFKNTLPLQNTSCGCF